MRAFCFKDEVVLRQHQQREEQAEGSVSIIFFNHYH
jgi:hypothetical protein